MLDLWFYGNPISERTPRIHSLRMLWVHHLSMRHKYIPLIKSVPTHSKTGKFRHPVSDRAKAPRSWQDGPCCTRRKTENLKNEEDFITACLKTFEKKTIIKKRPSSTKTTQLFFINNVCDAKPRRKCASLPMKNDQEKKQGDNARGLCYFREKTSQDTFF